MLPNTIIAISLLTSQKPIIPPGWKFVDDYELHWRHICMRYYVYYDEKNNNEYRFFFTSKFVDYLQFSRGTTFNWPLFLENHQAFYSCAFYDGTIPIRQESIDSDFDEFGEDGKLQHHECVPGFTWEQMMKFASYRFLPEVWYREKLTDFLLGFAPMLRAGNLPILPLLEIFQKSHPEVEEKGKLSYYLQWQIAMKVQKMFV